LKVRIRNGKKTNVKNVPCESDVAVNSGLGEKIMEKAEEKAIFDKATEKLDLYVPLCLEDGCVDDAREFLQPGGQYMRFA